MFRDQELHKVHEDTNEWQCGFCKKTFRGDDFLNVFVNQIGLRHKINDDLMIYPGYIPRPGVEPILLHYGLPFSVGNWSFSKLNHHEDGIVYDCNRLFPRPPYPREVDAMELDPIKRRGLFLSIECINTINEGLFLHHVSMRCSKPSWSKYLSFLKSKRFLELTSPKYLKHENILEEKADTGEVSNNPVKANPKMHTVFSTECTSYFDWQTVGLMHSFHLSGQPGNITRLLSCSEDELKKYTGHDLAPTHYVPSMSKHPLTGDWYPAINKPAGVLHWLNHANIDAEFIVILDADMILRGPITPWEFNAQRGRPVSTPYDYLIGCDNELAKLHTRHPEACDKVGGVIIMHIDDLRKFALYWLHKTEEVRADKAHYGTNLTGDIYGSGWISEMYGYSFGSAELNLRHTINSEILLYPGYIPTPGTNPRVFHYGLQFGVGNWTFDKANWRNTDVVNTCWAKFPDPPDLSTLSSTDPNSLRRDQLSIECMRSLNEGLLLHHKKSNCPDPNIKSGAKLEVQKEATLSKADERTDVKIPRIRRLTVPIDFDSATSKKEDVAGTLRPLVIGLWALSVLGFLAVMSVILSGHKGETVKNKANKNKRRASYSGSTDFNGKSHFPG